MSETLFLIVKQVKSGEDAGVPMIIKNRRLFCFGLTGLLKVVTCRVKQMGLKIPRKDDKFRL